MKKSELKVGETYACFMNPATARRRHRFDKPFKATLVELNGATSYTQLRVDYDGNVKEEERKTLGIIVRLAEPKRRKRPKYIGPIGYSQMKPKARKLIDKNEEVEDKIELVALRNAGCFVSTWADYESAEKAAKEAEERRAQQEKERIEREAAASADNTKRIEGVRRILRERFGYEEAWDSWRGTPERYEYGLSDHPSVSLEIQTTREGNVLGARVTLADTDFMQLLADEVTERLVQVEKEVADRA